MLTTLVFTAVGALAASDLVRNGREKCARSTFKPYFSKTEKKVLKQRGHTDEKDVSKRLPLTKEMIEIHSYSIKSLVPTFYTEKQTSIHLDHEVIAKIDTCNNIQVTPKIIKYMTNRMNNARRKTFISEIETISGKIMKQYIKKTGFTDIHTLVYHLPYHFEKYCDFKNLKISYFDVDSDCGFFYHVAVKRLSEKAPFSMELEIPSIGNLLNKKEIIPESKFHNSLSRYPDISNMAAFNTSSTPTKSPANPVKTEKKKKAKRSFLCF